MDDFCIIEIVHKGSSSLQRTIDDIEGIIDTCTVSAAYSPRLPDEIPDIKDRSLLKLLRELILDGSSTCSDLSNRLKMSEVDVIRMIDYLTTHLGVRILPLLSEEDFSPYPCFSFIASLDSPGSLPEALTTINKMAPLVYDRTPLIRPPGIWMRSFGVDLHSMDHMLERIRRTPWVQELTVILPEGVQVDRKIDLSIIDAQMKK